MFLSDPGVPGVQSTGPDDVRPSGHDYVHIVQT